MKYNGDNLRGKNWAHITSIFTRMKTIEFMVNGKKADHEFDIVMEPGNRVVIDINVKRPAKKKAKNKYDSMPW